MNPRGWRIVVLLFGLAISAILAVSSFCGFSSYINRAAFPVRGKQLIGCLIAARDVPAGKVIDDEDLELKMIDAGRQPHGVLSSKSIALHRKCLYPIKKGMWIGFHDFGL
ncbi:MAG: hypothetical protein IPP57_07080 [Candidatus Obscuribacter sp.]|nr:hypothetical protein [Candidatus Obscuribacter sp.]MDQ5966661.1 hypothetical protein [Cyanobacteriota bacterium erpe_2018_sw_39hr_WHONDRS-SW48-000098_B_bin.30]MBK7840471.1 hypothetical protein [Candidatus Obscuribacter sp.]MBK9201668.1 hypothetical protein [Candidatus Obscuribacter sp.]MBK9619965.1 hypothetical protein [Candidatus Obscuribacter sp.]